jgi:glycosyltransferase involved in cell wall biosynthesis
VPPGSTRPAISVITPAHNTAEFIDSAIRSALTQTVADLEVIVIDDGSTDATGEVADVCRAADDRVRILRNPNPLGVSAARNRAMAAARGQFFAFLDSDDEWMPTFLEVQLEAFREFSDAAVVNGNALNLRGPLDGRPFRPPTTRPRRISLLEMLEHEDALSIMSVFRREVFETIGGFDQSLVTNEDYEFWLRAAVAGFVFVQTPQPLVRYRRRADSASADELKMIEGIGPVLARARTWCDERPTERAAIDRQIARFERDALALRAKIALRARDFTQAEDYFHALYKCQPLMRHALMALASRVAPRSLWWADRLRRSFII